MADLNGYNANDYEPTVAFEPVPAGKYLAAITESEMKPTKKGDGDYLQLEFTVLEGEYKGRKVWDRLCINHPKAITQNIARSNLSAICRAVGVMEPGDSADLHEIPLVINVKCKKRDDNGEMTNEIKSYSARKSQQAATQSPAGQAESGQNNAPQSSQNNSIPPWQR